MVALSDICKYEYQTEKNRLKYFEILRPEDCLTLKLKTQ
jgi:hypothetical protein